MRQTVIAGNNTSHAKRREERRHDARAEPTRAAMIAGIGWDFMPANIVIAAEDLADKQHDYQKEESHGAYGRIDEHGCRTLHRVGQYCQMLGAILRIEGVRQK